MISVILRSRVIILIILAEMTSMLERLLNVLHGFCKGLKRSGIIVSSI
jgi:hypothetical protein